jgi:hypothetical protein
MKSMHAQIKDGLAELSRARFNPDEFYSVIDRHVSLIGESLKNYRNAMHINYMCAIGNALTDGGIDDHALQWKAVERIAAILEQLKK